VLVIGAGRRARLTRVAYCGVSRRGGTLLLADQRRSRCRGCLGKEILDPAFPDDDFGGHPAAASTAAAARS
jgi:hypothetical protein